MNRRHRILPSLLAVCLALGSLIALAETPTDQAASGYHVAWTGKLMKVHRQGDARPHADLVALAKKPGSFALGPLAGLRGEITVLDGKVLVSQMVDGKVAIEETWAHQAPFLVYGQVTAWTDFAIPETVTDSAGLEAWVAKTARSHGIDMERPFPFKVRTSNSTVGYHVIDNPDAGYTITKPHRELMRFFEVKDIPVSLIGVYSTKHAGVFTHHSVATHIHMASDDKKHAGHVDSVEIGKGAMLFLPAAGK